MTAGYHILYETGELKKLRDEALNLFESCTVCPRKCRINGLKNWHPPIFLKAISIAEFSLDLNILSTRLEM